MCGEMLSIALLLGSLSSSDDAPVVTFGKTTTPSSVMQLTPQMRKAYTRIQRIHSGLRREAISAAVGQLFEDIGKYDPRVFVPLIVYDLVRIAPKDPRTLVVLQTSLKEGWLDPIGAHALLLQAGEPPEKHIAYLITQLDSPNTTTRISAIDALKSCGARAQRALPLLERIVRESNAPPRDYVSDYTITHPAPEHVHAKWAIDWIEKCVKANRSKAEVSVLRTTP